MKNDVSVCVCGSEASPQACRRASVLPREASSSARAPVQRRTARRCWRAGCGRIGALEDLRRRSHPPACFAHHGSSDGSVVVGGGCSSGGGSGSGGASVAAGCLRLRQWSPLSCLHHHGDASAHTHVQACAQHAAARTTSAIGSAMRAPGAGCAPCAGCARTWRAALKRGQAGRPVQRTPPPARTASEAVDVRRAQPAAASVPVAGLRTQARGPGGKGARQVASCLLLLRRATCVS
jgi:hypothetical protein